MNTKATILFLILILMPLSTFSAADHSYKSKYAGEEKRGIKSLPFRQSSRRALGLALKAVIVIAGHAGLPKVAQTAPMNNLP